MMTTKTRLFLATPSYKAWYHREFMFGCLEASHRFSGLAIDSPVLAPAVDEGLYVCDRRDRLTKMFLESGADHILWIDSDMGFRARHIEMLLDARREVISGSYLWKDDRACMMGVPIGGVEKIQRMQSVGSGFLLCTRSAIERACAVLTERSHLHHYPDIPGLVKGLWQPHYLEGEGHEKDDGAFSRHCRTAGIEMWCHRECILTHWGEKCFAGEPKMWLRPGREIRNDSAGSAVEPDHHHE